MNIVQKVMLLIACVTAMTACDSEGRYESDGNIVRYSHWTFSFGTLYDTLPGADPATFHSVNDWLGCDARRAYFKADSVAGVDVATLKADRYPMFHDRKDYYYESTPIRVADYATFKVIKWIDDDFWAKDSRCAYYDTLHIPEADLPTFKVKSFAHAVDKNHVYRFGELLELADPKTYEECWKDLYGRDKSHIWYAGRLLEDVDYATFTVDEDGNGHDKYGTFHCEKRVTADGE